LVVDVDRVFAKVLIIGGHSAAPIYRFFVHVHVHDDDDDHVDGGFSRDRTFGPQNNLSALADSD
jgi:hypothetical protein